MYRPNYIPSSPDVAPILTVVVHTEEEFNWSAGFNSNNMSVNHMKHIDRFQSIADKYAIKPVYVVGHPIASQKTGYVPLSEIEKSGRAEIGTHLHPWVAPPLVEKITVRNSYPGNLDSTLEYDKINCLTEMIENNFNLKPLTYLAGRYGVGPNTIKTLIRLGYQTDISASPAFDYSIDGGPDFTSLKNFSGWLNDEKTLLAIPNSGSYTGLLRRSGPQLHSLLQKQLARKLHLTGVLSRVGLLNKIRLTPEGYTLNELRLLTTTLLNQGVRHFVFFFHSPSIVPQNTPYVRNQAELEQFLTTCDEYFNFFKDQVKGKSMTAIEYHKWFSQTSNNAPRQVELR